MPSAHVDTFARDHLPPPEQQPEFIFELPSLHFPAQLNCATELLDRHLAEGRGERVCIRAPGLTWTYRELQERADRIAHVLVHDMGVVPGNRVLLRAPNCPVLAACWFAVMKAGAIAVGTMPLLRAERTHPYIESWWPPGHIVGWVHAFTHTVFDLLEAVADRRVPSPSFADGVRNQRVLEATERAARTRRWIGVTGVA